jgi:hypothetical protein
VWLLHVVTLWVGVQSGCSQEAGGRQLVTLTLCQPTVHMQIRHNAAHSFTHVHCCAVLCCAVLCCADDDLRVILSKLPEGVKFTMVAGEKGPGTHTQDAFLPAAAPCCGKLVLSGSQLQI